MISAAPFLAAIRADPDNVALRLVYCDWLQDNGRDAYAEVVRAACDCFEWPTWWQIGFVSALSSFTPHPTILGQAAWELAGTELPSWLMTGDCIRRNDKTLWQIMAMEKSTRRVALIVRRVEMAADSLAAPERRIVKWQALQAVLKGKDIPDTFGIPYTKDTSAAEIIFDRFYGLHTLQCSWDYWTANEAAILAAHPLRRVELNDAANVVAALRWQSNERQMCREYWLSGREAIFVVSDIERKTIRQTDSQYRAQVVQRCLATEWPGIEFGFTGRQRVNVGAGGTTTGFLERMSDRIAAAALAGDRFTATR